MSFAQFKENVFDQNQVPAEQQNSPNLNAAQQAEAAPVLAPDGEASESAMGVPGPGDQEEGPGNPGEPVPINGYIPVLLLSGLALIFYSQRNKKINI